jgi:hypothetical protein
MSAADQERARIQAILDAVDETLERADETLRRLDEQPDETVEAAPWPRSESDPSRSDELYRYGIKLADPHGLERGARRSAPRPRRENARAGEIGF